MLIKTLNILGYVWLALTFAAVAIGSLAILIQDGLMEFLWLFSPFNIWNYLLIILMAAPGFGLLMIADKLEEKQNGL